MRRECGQKCWSLVGATYLAYPVLPSRCLLPPTLTYCRGGGHRLQRPRSSRLLRSTVNTRLRRGPRCPLQALLQAGNPDKR